MISITKQNVRFWTTENLRLTVANPLHPEGVTIWCSLSSFGILGPSFIDGTVTSDIQFMHLSFPWLDTQFQRIHPEKTRRRQTSHQQSRTAKYSWWVPGESPVSSVFRGIWGRIFMATSLVGHDSCDYFLGGIWGARCFRKRPYKILEMKTPIQSEIDDGPNGKTTVSVYRLCNYLHNF